MTKKELIEKVYSMPSISARLAEVIAEHLINQGVVTLDPEPGPFECWLNLYCGNRITVHRLRSLAEEELPIFPGEVKRTVHMREVTGIDYKKMWEQLKERWAYNMSLASSMESIEKENE
jgi:hypothetical protein